MTWLDVAPPDRGPAAKAVMMVAARDGRKSSTRQRPSEMSLVIRRHLMDEPPPWLVFGARVRVQFGDGLNSNQIRITDKGAYPVQRTANAHGGEAPLLILMRLPIGVAPGKRLPVEVEFDHTDEWVQVTLPEWAKGQKALPAPEPARASGAAAPVPPPPRATPGGFVSVSDRTPDPAAALRDPRNLRK